MIRQVSLIAFVMAVVAVQGMAVDPGVDGNATSIDQPTRTGEYNLIYELWVGGEVVSRKVVGRQPVSTRDDVYTSMGIIAGREVRVMHLKGAPQVLYSLLDSKTKSLPVSFVYIEGLGSQV